jgi:hypothetical protein
MNHFNLEFCPVFRPTEKEFGHPFEFIRSIHQIGSRSGIVKIIPPDGWRPSLFDSRSSRSPQLLNTPFKTRTQSLGSLDGQSRILLVYCQSLYKYHLTFHQTLFTIPDVQSRMVHMWNLRTLYYSMEEVSPDWEKISQKLGFDKKAAPDLKNCFEKWILPYETWKEATKSMSNVTTLSVPMGGMKSMKAVQPSQDQMKRLPSNSNTTIAATPKIEVKSLFSSDLSDLDEDDMELLSRAVSEEEESSSSKDNDSVFSTPDESAESSSDDDSDEDGSDSDQSESSRSSTPRRKTRNNTTKKERQEERKLRSREKQVKKQIPPPTPSKSASKLPPKEFYAQEHDVITKY